MRPQLGLRVRRVGVCEARTRQNSTTLDTRVEALLAQRQPLQMGEVVFLCGAAVSSISMVLEVAGRGHTRLPCRAVSRRSRGGGRLLRLLGLVPRLR